MDKGRSFLCYTNDGGQTQALFQVDHPPRDLLDDDLWDLRYETPTGWARGSAVINFGFHGLDGTSSIAWVSVETTNVPARVVLNLLTRRKNFYGLYDRVIELLPMMRGKSPGLHGDSHFLTNQTIVTRP